MGNSGEAKSSGLPVGVRSDGFPTFLDIFSPDLSNPHRIAALLSFICPALPVQSAAGHGGAFPLTPYYALYGVVCHDSDEQTSASMRPAAGPAPIRTMSIPSAGLFSGLSERAPCLLRGKSQRLAPPMHHAAARPVAFSNPLK